MRCTAQPASTAWGTRDGGSWTKSLIQEQHVRFSVSNCRPKRWVITITPKHWPCSVTDFASASLTRVSIARLPAGNTARSARPQSGLFIPVHFPDEPNRIRHEPGSRATDFVGGAEGLNIRIPRDWRSPVTWKGPSD